MGKVVKLFAIPMILLAIGVVIFGIKCAVEYQMYFFSFFTLSMASSCLIMAYVFWTTDKE